MEALCDGGEGVGGFSWLFFWVLFGGMGLIAWREVPKCRFGLRLWDEMGDSEFGGMVSRVLHVRGGC
jgi:hypothetical protein